MARLVKGYKLHPKTYIKLNFEKNMGISILISHRDFQSNHYLEVSIVRLLKYEHQHLQYLG